MIDVTVVYISDTMLCVHSGKFHCLIVDIISSCGTESKALVKSMVVITKPLWPLRASRKSSFSMIPCSKIYWLNTGRSFAKNLSIYLLLITAKLLNVASLPDGPISDALPQFPVVGSSLENPLVLLSLVAGEIPPAYAQGGKWSAGTLRTRSSWTPSLRASSSPARTTTSGATCSP
jgi:hypothetical protein